MFLENTLIAAYATGLSKYGKETKKNKKHADDLTSQRRTLFILS